MPKPIQTEPPDASAIDANMPQVHRTLRTWLGWVAILVIAEIVVWNIFQGKVSERENALVNARQAEEQTGWTIDPATGQKTFQLVISRETAANAKVALDGWRVWQYGAMLVVATIIFMIGLGMFAEPNSNNSQQLQVEAITDVSSVRKCASCEIEFSADRGGAYCQSCQGEMKKG